MPDSISDLTPRLSLPFLLPAQAQKHVTHNEALLGLDAVVQLTVEGTRNAPPESPAEGICYWVGTAPAGPWSGRTARLAAFQDGAWSFLLPRPGWRALFRDLGRLMVFDGSLWQELPLPPAGRFETLGVAAAADSVNRLAVAAQASLFSHDALDGSHRLKINRADTGDVASVLFQSGWQGRAEIGLAGSEGFAVKVSGDGEHWTTGLALGTDGIARMDSRPACLAGRAATDASPASGSVGGFSEIFAGRGGFALGTAIGSVGNRLVVPATGLYLVALTARIVAASGYALAVTRNGASALATLEGQYSGAAPETRTALALAALSAGDYLALAHQGSLTLRFGPAGTSLLIMLI